MERSRVVEWEDPMVGAMAARRMSGMEYMERMMSGEFAPPPVAQTLDFRPSHLEVGRVIFTFTPAEFHYNPIGTVHGGVIATICDSAMGCAVQTTLPAGVGYTTLELKTNFIKAVTIKSGQLFCEGTVIHGGGRVAIAECRLTDEAGTLYAHATTTCLVIKPQNGS